jgi:VWFA-related protein
MRNLAALALLAGSTVAFCQTPASPVATFTATSTAGTLSVNARLVTVPVTVRDKKGQLVNNLKQSDFTIAADNKPQVIRYFDRDNDVQLTLGLLVDVSMSQRNTLDEERDASSAFLDDMLVPERDKAFVISFGRTVDLLVDTTGSIPRLQAGLKKIEIGQSEDRPRFNSGGDDSQNGSRQDRIDRVRSMFGTALYDSIFLASDEVMQKQQQRKALILLTDGVDSGSKKSLTSAIESAQRANTAVYAIYFKGQQMPGGGGFGRGGGMGGRRGMGGRGGGFPGGGGGGPQREQVDGKKILDRITGETGGRLFEVDKKNNVAAIYKQIAEELRNQYRIGFTPADISDGYHTLQVDLPQQKKLFIQTREGYYSGAR